jgi:hypothetical protein
MATDARQTYATPGTYDISIISNNPENEPFLWTSDPASLSGWDDTMRSKFKDIINWGYFSFRTRSFWKFTGLTTISATDIPYFKFKAKNGFDRELNGTFE